MNVALGAEPDSDLQQFFFNLIDYFTPPHIELLQFLQNPREFVSMTRQDIDELFPNGPSTTLAHIEETLVLSRGDLPPFRTLLEDLVARGLTHGPRADQAGGSVSWAPSTTELGDRFLLFISEQ